MSDYLAEKGIVHVKYVPPRLIVVVVFQSLYRYRGDMNRDKRDQAVRVPMSKDEAKVALMSLKCGGMFALDLLLGYHNSCPFF